MVQKQINKKKQGLLKFFVLSQKSKKIKFFNFFFKILKLSIYIKSLLFYIKINLKNILIKFLKNTLILKKINMFIIFILKKKIKFLKILFYKIKYWIQLFLQKKKVKFYYIYKIKKQYNLYNNNTNRIFYNCFVKISKNNIRIHINYYSFSKLFLIISSGKYRIPGVNKIKKTICETMGKLCAILFKKYKIANNIKNFYFFGSKYLIKTFLQNFNNDIFINNLINYKIYIKDPYNGCRLKKQRRL